MNDLRSSGTVRKPYIDHASVKTSLPDDWNASRQN